MAAQAPHDRQFLKPREVATLIGENVETVRRYMRKGVITYYEIGPFKLKRIHVRDAQRLVGRSVGAI